MRFVKKSILIISACISILGFLNLFGVLPILTEFISSQSDVVQNIIKLIVFLIALFYMICIIINDRNNKNEHILTVEKRSYYKYFVKWYRKTGKIKIFCGNLQWIRNSELMNVLKQKSQNGDLSIYLEKQDNNSETLKKAGAKIFIVKKVNMNILSFSIRNVDASESFIIRYNTEDDHTGREVQITVHEIYKEPQKMVLKELSKLIEETVEIKQGDMV